MDHATRTARLSGAGMLLLATCLWGTTFVVVKGALVGAPASVITFARFAVAAGVLLPFLRLERKLWLIGAELGIWLGLGYALQTIGLRHTTVNRSAFLTAMNAVFVPIIVALLGGRVSGKVWLAVGLAIAGTGLLTYEGGKPNRGDLWTLGCAAAWAMYIWRLEVHMRRLSDMKMGALKLAATNLLWTAIFCGFWTMLDPAAQGQWNKLDWRVIVYLAIAATALTTLLQVMGQARVPATETAILFTTEPVWASFFGFLWLGEVLGTQGLVGAGLILVGAVMSQIPERENPNDQVRLRSPQAKQ